jgi:hypothetical protein
MSNKKWEIISEPYTAEPLSPQLQELKDTIYVKQLVWLLIIVFLVIMIIALLRKIEN